jgi:hypothetical protein
MSDAYPISKPVLTLAIRASILQDKLRNGWDVNTLHARNQFVARRLKTFRKSPEVLEESYKTGTGG